MKIERSLYRLLRSLDKIVPIMMKEPEKYAEDIDILLMSLERLCVEYGHREWFYLFMNKKREILSIG